MDVYIKRKDVLSLAKKGYLVGNGNYQSVKNYINSIPAADVRPVVYCEECKHRPAKEYGRIIAPKDADGYTDYKCPFVCEDSWYNRMPADDNYCSCGKKREES